jgi:hypothetical protein
VACANANFPAPSGATQTDGPHPSEKIAPPDNQLVG